jgi:L-amino acid N-acyltransferase YncA
VNKIATKADYNVRPLSASDLDRVIKIDSGHVGKPRRRFFEKRLAHAVRHPDDYLHVGVVRDGSLIGFAFARIMRGEFGRAQAVSTLDAVAVEQGSRERGVGHALMEGLTKLMREKGVQSLQSQADWTNNGLLRFFGSSGFTLAPRLVMERSVLAPLVEPSEET